MPICRYKNEDGSKCKFGGSAEEVNAHEVQEHGKAAGGSERTSDFGSLPLVPTQRFAALQGRYAEQCEQRKQSRVLRQKNPDKAAYNREDRPRGAGLPQW